MRWSCREETSRAKALGRHTQIFKERCETQSFLSYHFHKWEHQATQLSRILCCIIHPSKIVHRNNEINPTRLTQTISPLNRQ